VLLEAGFFAVAQVLVYIGAISILIIFAVMLTRGMQSMIPRNSQAVISAIVAAAVFALMVAMFWGKPNEPLTIFRERQIGGIPWDFDGEPDAIAPVSPTYISNFGKALTDINQYAVPFELASVLIVLAMIGSIFVARERRPAEVIAERAEIAAEEAAELELPRQEKLPLPEVAPAHMDTH
jgi:NADH-quinone oxidoreductase subunit J